MLKNCEHVSASHHVQRSPTVDDDNHIHLTRFYPVAAMDEGLCEVQGLVGYKEKYSVSSARPVLRKTKFQNHVSQAMKEKWRRLSKMNQGDRDY